MNRRKLKVRWSSFPPKVLSSFLSTLQDSRRSGTRGCGAPWHPREMLIWMVEWRNRETESEWWLWWSCMSVFYNFLFVYFQQFWKRWQDFLPSSHSPAFLINWHCLTPWSPWTTQKGSSIFQPLTHLVAHSVTRWLNHLTVTHIHPPLHSVTLLHRLHDSPLCRKSGFLNIPCIPCTGGRSSWDGGVYLTLAGLQIDLWSAGGG